MVIWEACRAGTGFPQGAGFLVGWWMRLSCAMLVPVLVGWGSSHYTWGWSPAGLMSGSPRGRCLVIPHVAGVQQGQKGGGLRGSRYPGKLWDWLRAGDWCR
jgi:hypothetical protein